ncbi:GspE/PulE family protein [Desulfoluna spongiiphila]|uniref:Type II secretory pathway ATPase GspE/PulE or T4P pilus assembly pathway ATPase PilB n=1 Tax=Desulfoluna spongiiphila TaxID=419481 RepID=A0A1G5FNC9_9BACT|nr:GspE/PulE family protein [Desulfoluna spongiiphila]SCY40785.1 Type II secretory pathway ATPase GspE/PulE or T4P pilus assembly pathway ATPase PilB [Desulfoluna spongiiphila]VVS95499.1 type ii/iv secretion system protein [Desulfoluna spongiiphila]
MEKQLKSKIDTAKAYKKHGLYGESIAVYTAILDAYDGDLDEEVNEFIGVELNDLRTKAAELDDDDEVIELSSQELNAIKNSWSEDSAGEILESAHAFKELGLHREALGELLKLLNTKYSVSKLVPQLAEALMQLHAVSKIRKKVLELIETNNVTQDAAADILFRFGLEMEKLEKSDEAMGFYEDVRGLDVDYTGLDAQMEGIKGSRSYESRYGYLLDTDQVNAAQLQNALNLARKTGKSCEAILLEDMYVDKEELGKSLSYYYECPFVEFSTDTPIPVELLGKLKKSFLIQNSWVPLTWDMTEGVVEVLIDDPKNLEKTDHIYTLLNAKHIRYSVGVREEIIELIKFFYDSDRQAEEGPGEDDGGEFDMMLDVEFEEEADEGPDDQEQDGTLSESSSQIVKMVDQVIITAYRKGASDIHVEPSPHSKKVHIRYRIDGVCQDVLKIPISNAMGIISRLKIMSHLDIAERRLPQDGKIKFKRKGVKPFELRLATLPTAGGYEDAVLRILADSGAMKIDQMGLTDRNLDVLKRIIAQPYGLILCVGPTGSGKTTTLHAAMGHINKPGIKIWTAEDPVEITQPGLRQVECRAKIGLDFARVMRAFLRADPDVIMIGEMRDNETASIGIEASLTGHLVLSTLHTNSAPETVTRLLDMGLNPLNFSDAFQGVLAQRLVRRLCTNCRDEYTPDREEFDRIVELYGAEAFEQTGIRYSSDMRLFKPVGCSVCSGSGYKGRLAIHELMYGSADVKQMIKRAAHTDELFRVAAEEGMTTLIQDGIIKALDGLTDVAEIRRVCVS